MPKKPVVYLAQPHYGALDPGAAEAFYATAQDDENAYDIRLGYTGGSLLAKVFNDLLCTALNEREEHGITHFAMLHADIRPKDVGWLDILLAELLRTGADVLSAVVPLKSHHGLTSTALDSLDHPFRVERRLTMREVFRLPETFDAGDCGYPDRALLINTGCWIADIDSVWPRDEEPGQVRHFFTIRDRIVRNPDGKYESQVMSEDWHFGRMLHAAGKKVMATRKVRLRHMGAQAHDNYREWGSYQIDHMAKGPLPIFADR